MQPRGYHQDGDSITRGRLLWRDSSEIILYFYT